jgi:hypothetical protein
MHKTKPRIPFVQKSVAFSQDLECSIVLSIDESLQSSLVYVTDSKDLRPDESVVFNIGRHGTPRGGQPASRDM